MSTFIQGITDNIAPAEVYKPDYAFLTQVYGQRQAEYDRGFNMVKNIYNSALSNPLTSESNEFYRQEVMKKLQNSIKSISGVDLSDPTNVMRAQEIFNPISKDEELAYDMQVTSFHQKQKQRMEQYKNSTDPKMRAQYNDFSRQAIGFAEEDMRSAKRGEGAIQKVRPQEFVPMEDIAEYLNKAAKEQNIGIKVATADGKNPYIVTYGNGKMSYAAFTNWAATQMGNRFDRQLQQQGWVQAEGAIRSIQQSQGVSRDQALQMVSTEFAKKLQTESEEDNVTADKELVKIESKIKLIEEKYPDGINDPDVKEQYVKALQEKDAYVNQRDGSGSMLTKLQQDGQNFVAQNIHGIFAQQAKKQTAQMWAQGYSDATATVDIKSDDVVLTKWKMAQERQLTAAKMKQERELKLMDMQQDQENADREYALKVKIAQGKGELPSESYLGRNAAGQQTFTGVDVYMDGMAKNRDNLFNATFGANNGMMNLVVGAAEHGKYYNVIQKVQQISQGNTNVQLSEEDKKLLTDYGKMVSAKVIDPNNNPQAAQALLDGFVSATYDRSRELVKDYTAIKKTGDVKKMSKTFSDALASMNIMMTQRENILRNAKEISKEITDGYGNLKSGYEAAKLLYRLEDGTPVYDLSGLSDAQQSYLSNRLDAQYSDRARVTGDTFEFSGITSAELFQLIDGAAAGNTASSIEVTETGEKISPTNLSSMSPVSIKELMGNAATVSYDAQGEKVKVKFKVDINSTAAKTLGIKKGETVTVTLPYSTIRENQLPLERFNKYLGRNSVNSTDLGEFSVFAANPNSIISAPAYMNSYGFDYTASGVRDETGAFGLGLTFTYYDPTTKRQEKMYNFQKISNPEDPTAYIGASNHVAQMFENYLTQKEMSETGK